MRNANERPNPVVSFTIAASLLTCLSIAVAPRAARSADNPKVRSDTDAIQGTWKLLSQEINGKAVPATEDGDAVRIRFEGDKCFHMKGDKKADPADFKLDSNKNPKQIDIVASTDGDKGKTLRGIYELNGDRLKLCVAYSGDRPTKFKSDDDKDHEISILERDK